MNAGTLAHVGRDLVNLLDVAGILRPDGTFDQSKLDTIAEDLILARQIEGVLKDHGLLVPDRVDRIIGILPLVAALVGI
jgi:hypothetical protein